MNAALLFMYIYIQRNRPVVNCMVLKCTELHDAVADNYRFVCELKAVCGA